MHFYQSIEAKSLYTAALVCYICGFIAFPALIASSAFSLHMVRNGYIVQKAQYVIIFSIVELLAIVSAIIVALFGYYMIVALMLVVTLLCGIPRIIMCGDCEAIKALRTYNGVKV